MISVKGLLVVRPAAFGFNPETAASNSFQQQVKDAQPPALQEFDALMRRLAKCKIPIEVIDDLPQPAKPDAIFPNNWFSTHPGGVLMLYPMCAPNRRLERLGSIIEKLWHNYRYQTLHDLTAFEKEEKFLEGTGSIVFDHEEKIAYAAFSPRTDKDVLLEACERLGFLPLAFLANDRHGKAIYHTNVVMALHKKLAIVCLESILPEDRRAVTRMLEISGRTILPITFAQMEAYAGNVLFVRNAAGKDFVLLSQSAWNAFLPEQQKQIASYAEPIVTAIPTIEKAGGGSVRCMIAELY